MTGLTLQNICISVFAYFVGSFFSVKFATLVAFVGASNIQPLIDRIMYCYQPFLRSSKTKDLKLDKS